ncbi:MAG: hypothetical protein QNJ11_18020 [Woeseiaceae bacterium]|nr:hypothetical protein [Woeseiaceae bacterium]
MRSPSGPSFEMPETAQLWEDYVSRVDALTRPLALPQRRDIMLEIHAHLLESMLDKRGDETHRLREAQQSLGDPDEFIPGWVQDRLEENADASLVLHSRWQLMRLNAARGIRGLLKSVIHGFGHMLVFYSFLMALLKPFYPDNIGVFTSPSGWPIVGFVDAGDFQEHFGWWFVPAALLFGSVVFWWLNYYRGGRHASSSEKLR